MLFLRVGYAKEQIYSIMKQDIEVKYMLAHERNDYILTKLNAKGCVNVRHLSQELAVSEVTIRRDLEEMEKQGLLIRIHGGAKKNPKTDILSKNKKTAFVSKQQNSSRMGIVFFWMEVPVFFQCFHICKRKRLKSLLIVP